MSGHSKWANIKHRKESQDAKKASVFTKLAKDISIAARNGGDPTTNFQLRLTVDKARSFNMPKENIERAIKKGTGELKGESQIEEIVYEAYGPGQIAMLIKVATDNKNRTLGEVRNILNKNGGKMVEGGSVSWQFELVGNLEAKKGNLEADVLEEKIIESGAKDYRAEDETYYVYSAPSDLQKVKEALEHNAIEVADAALVYLAKNTIAIDDHTRIDYEKLLGLLDDNDDVVEVYDNIAEQANI